MARKPVIDSSDPEQVAAAEKLQDDEEFDLDYILKHHRGRRWLYRLIHDPEFCHKDLQSLYFAEHDATAFNEGARSIGIKVAEEIKLKSVPLWHKLLEEND